MISAAKDDSAEQSIRTQTILRVAEPLPIADDNGHQEVRYFVTRPLPILQPAYEILLLVRKCASREYHSAAHRGYRVVSSFQDELFLTDCSLPARVKRALGCLWPGYLSVELRCFVTTDEYRKQRLLTVESLNGRHAEQTDRIRKLVQSLSKELATIHYEEPQIQEELAEDIDDDTEDGYSLASAANYMFGKMLLETKYSLGGKVKEFLEKCRPITVERRDVEWLEQMKQEVSGDMLRGFNCSRKQLDGILPYCRHVVEEFLYSRVYSGLYHEEELQVAPLEGQFQDFERTASQIVRFARCPIPGLQNILIGKILEAMDFEYDLRERTTSKRVILGQLVQMQQIPHLRNRLLLLRYYQEISGGGAALIRLFSAACQSISSSH